MTFARRLLLSAAALALALADGPAARADAASDAPGTYRLAGAVRLDAAPFPARSDELHADAVLSAGREPRALRLQLAVQTFRCELRATLDAAGTLVLPAGQRCPVTLPDPAEGHLEATLRSGAGTVRDGALALTLVFALSGRARLRPGAGLDALGEVLSLPGTGERWTDVSGEVRGQASGRRDASRAAEDGTRPP